MLIIALLFGVYYGFKAYKIASSLLSSLNRIERIVLEESDEALGINEGARDNHKDKNITNIAVFGLDSRSGEVKGRSDTIMFVSIDKDTYEINVVSVLRDTYVSIPDQYDAKINAAYSIGGPQLAIKTLNRNFDMDISDFIAVDFKAIVDAVDALGGITLTVEQEHLTDLNKTIKNTNKIFKNETASPTVKKAGEQTLDGKQTLAYIRMRNTGNADFDRTSRQRKAVTAILAKIKQDFSVDLILGVARDVSDDIVTSLSNTEIFDLTYKILKSDSPANTAGLTKHVTAKSIDRQSVLFPDTLQDLSTELHTKLYGEGGYTPTKSLGQRSRKLYNSY